MNAVLHSLLISAAIVLLWYLWERFLASCVNEQLGLLALFIGEGKPNILGFILPWLGVAVLNYFMPTFWFWFIIAIVALLILAPVFGSTVIWWVILFCLIGVAIWWTMAKRANPSTETIPEKTTVSFLNDSQFPTNHRESKGFQS